MIHINVEVNYEEETLFLIGKLTEHRRYDKALDIISHSHEKKPFLQM